MVKTSTLLYRTKDGVVETLEIPTIQSLDIPDCSCIPSRPTITGEYRNQFVNQSPPKVGFVAWLESEKYGEAQNEMNIASILDVLLMLKDQRIKFNLTTTHEGEESRFLSDLVIESVSFNRDATYRNRLSIAVTCVKIKLIDLTWKQASAIEIFGTNIFTTEKLDSTRWDFVPASVDLDFGLSTDLWQKTTHFVSDVYEDYKNVFGLSGAREHPVAELIKDQIGAKIGIENMKKSLYFKLTAPIDLSTGSRNYNCKCAFQTGFGLGTSEKMYNMDVLSVAVSTKQKEVTLVPMLSLTSLKFSKVLNGLDIAWGPLVGGVSVALKEYHPDIYAEWDRAVTGSVYDFADTYTDFPLSKTFEHFENVDDLSQYVAKRIKEETISDTDATIRNGNIIIKDGVIYAYIINRRYEYTIKIGDSFTKTIVPDSSLRIDVFPLSTITTGFKPVSSYPKAQEYWDNLFRSGSSVNYTLNLVCINLGTLVQIYLFSTKLFEQQYISYNGSTGSSTSTTSTTLTQ